MHKGPRGTEAVESGHVVATVGTLRTRRPGEGGVQGDFDHIVPVISPALNTQSGSHHAPDTKAYVAFAQNTRDEVQVAAVVYATSAVRYGEHQQDTLHSENGILNTLPGGNNNNAAHYTKTAIGSAVRRLTPVECERLQGFPDNFTAIPWRKKPAEDCPDGPRYKALGNSMAVPVMRWIGERIQLVDDFITLF